MPYDPIRDINVPSPSAASMKQSLSASVVPMSLPASESPQPPAPKRHWMSIVNNDTPASADMSSNQTGSSLGEPFLAVEKGPSPDVKSTSPEPAPPTKQNPPKRKRQPSPTRSVFMPKQSKSLEPLKVLTARVSPTPSSKPMPTLPASPKREASSDQLFPETPGPRRGSIQFLQTPLSTTAPTPGATAPTPGASSSSQAYFPVMEPPTPHNPSLSGKSGKIPYNPHRITPGRSVHIPLPPSELQRLQAIMRNPLRKHDAHQHLMKAQPSPYPRQNSFSQPVVPPTPHAYSPSAIPYAPASPLPSSFEMIPVLPHAQIGAIDTAAPKSPRKRKNEGEPTSPRKRNSRKEEVIGVVKGEVKLVADHYNQRPNIDRVSRQDSPIIGLKSFNNWVKSVLIAKFARDRAAFYQDPIENPPADGRPPERHRLRVLDMGCGKGGDLAKWQKAGTEEYVAIDVAEVSVAQAHSRWQEMRPPRFAASFYNLDCFSHSLSTVLAPHQKETPFDVVSMQFCMHYAFESAAKARVMLENVSKHLRPGGWFLGTIPNSATLLENLQEVPEDAAELTFGNSVYRVKFESRTLKAFGHRYSFYLQDAVEDVPEYIVDWDAFVILAKEYKLKLMYHETFHGIFEEQQDNPEFKQLMMKMRVVNREGESELDEEQWEAANLYVGFAFMRM